MLGIIAADVLFFGVTDPSRAPSSYFIVAFVLLAANIFVGVEALYHMAHWHGGEAKRRLRQVGLVSGGICALVALQSIGQLSARDIGLLLPFGLLTYFYLVRNRRYE